MNLLTDCWLPADMSGGARDKFAAWQLSNSSITDIAAPRPDFQGALYQFLIGLLQTTFAPEDQDEWLKYWHGPPTADQLKVVFAKYSDAFELFSAADEPAFLQDYAMPEGERKPIAAMLVEAPGGKTLKDNLDHFVKGGTVAGVCESCAATALFTLQANAPAGGVGHRVGLRGGGPLTTLLLPEEDSGSLWQKLWLNVITAEELTRKFSTTTADVFPWMATTRFSDKSGVATLPGDVHDLQMYWGMPRRIRLEHAQASDEPCSLCGERRGEFYTHFRTKNYGVNYEGTWTYPLSPYRFDLKKEKPPLSLKGQKGGLGYRHWLGLNWLDPGNGDQAALNVRSFNAERADLIDGEEFARLWCFGYDMDNMKARCWYEHQMPVIAVHESYREDFYGFVANLIDAAKDVVKELRQQVKAAWFSRPKDAKGDTSMVDYSFWQATETEFYRQLHTLAEQPSNTRFMPPEVAGQWLEVLQNRARELFDHWVLEGDAEDLDMKRITKARRILFSRLKSLKSLKNLEQIASAESEVA